MAFEIQNFNDLPYRGSSNVTALSYTGVPPIYTSGGIPQFSVVTLDTGTGNESDVIIATSNTVMPVGIAQDGPATGPGQSVRVRASGVSKCIAGGAITVGQLVAVNASGQVVAAAAPAATNIFLIGQAESAATQAGDYLSVRLMIGATQQVNA